MKQEDFWFGMLAAWLLIWLWTRYRSNTLKLKYFKFWGNVSDAQRQDNLRGLGMTAALLLLNLLIRIF